MKVLLEKNNIKKILGTVLLIITGGVGGYLYWKFYGCRNGCPLQSNWMIMTIYGGIFGALISNILLFKNIKK